MCTAALQEELNGQIAGLSNESVRLLIEVAKSMKPASPAADENEGDILGMSADRPFCTTDEIEFKSLKGIAGRWLDLDEVRKERLGL